MEWHRRLRGAATIAMLGIAALALGQGPTADLEDRIANARGRKKVELLNELARAELRSSNPRATDLARKALEEAARLGDTAGEAQALKTLAVAAYYAGDLESAIDLSEQALVAARDGAGLELTIDLLQNLGVFHTQADEYDLALKAHERVLQLLGPDGQPGHRAKAEDRIGVNHLLKGEFDLALEHSLRALKIYRAEADQPAVAESLNTIAAILDELGRLDEAAQYYTESLQLFEKLDDPRGAVNPLNNLGVIYYSRHELDRADELHRRALAIRRESGDRRGEAVSLNNLGNVARERGDLTTALELYIQALQINQDIGARAQAIVSLRDIGDLHRVQGQLEKALDYASRSLATAREIGSKVDVKIALRDKSAIEAEMGRFEDALASFREYRAIENELLGEEASRRVAELETRFEMEKRNEEIAVLRRQTELQTRIHFTLATVILLILAITLLVWNRARMKQRANQLLADKNQQIADQNARLEELNWKLEEKNREYYASSITDALTGCYNKASIIDSMKKTFSLSRRHGHPMACVFYDLDHFKRINDEHGHLVGDKVLQQVAACIRSHVRQDDSLGRYGGEEFLLVLPNTRLRGARTVAEKIRARIEALDLHAAGIDHGVSVSGGIAEVLDGGALSPEELLRQADEALYRAKAQGRNCVVSYGQTVVGLDLPTNPST